MNEEVVTKITTIQNNYNLLVDKYHEGILKTINVELYLKDVPFLIEVIDILSGELKKQHKQKESK